MHELYEQMRTSVFERMSLAAARHQAINLGQGFPDFGWPEEILDAAATALREGSNQYAPSRGLPVLREALKVANPDWRPLIPEWDHISQQILGQALPDVITGAKPAKQALDAAVAPAEAVLRKAGWLKA